jgi:hypothetical protein
MPLWFWLLVAVAVLLGSVELILLPEQRRRRGLPKNTVRMPSRSARRDELARQDPITTQHIDPRYGGPL